MDIGALLPRRCRPFSLMESVPLKSKTQQLNAGALFPFCSRAEMWGLRIYGPAIPSTHDASSLGQVRNGLVIGHVSGLNFACQLTSSVGSHISCKSNDSKA